MSSDAKKKWMQPSFLIAVVILAVSAVGLNAAISALQLHLKKQPVALKMDLTSLPEKMGDWVQVSKDEPLDKELQDALATDHFIFRDYVNTALVTKEELDRFSGQGSKERKVLLAQLQATKPNAAVNLAVTYYTGGADTVAHIPDRCYIADGFEPSEYEITDWNVGPDHLGQATGQLMPVRFISFDDQTAAGRVPRRVAYFFFADGHYMSNPLDVRRTLQNLRYKHGFYAKIELMNVVPEHDKSQAVMTGFLTAALPDIEKCFPDWNQVEGGGSTH
jgi:hypothetical protein